MKTDALTLAREQIADIRSKYLENPQIWTLCDMALRSLAQPEGMEELKKLSAAAQPGPWKASDTFDTVYIMGPDLEGQRVNLFVGLWPIHAERDTESAERITYTTAEFVVRLVNWFRALSPAASAAPECKHIWERNVDNPSRTCSKCGLTLAEHGSAAPNNAAAQDMRLTVSSDAPERSATVPDAAAPIAESRFVAPYPLPIELGEVLSEYDLITAKADRGDPEWDFVMRASDYRILRDFFKQLKREGPPIIIKNPPRPA